MKALWLMVAATSMLVFASVASKRPKPAVHRRLDAERMRQAVETLMSRGYAGGILFLDVEGDDRFLQLRQEMTREGPATLRCDFPLTEWSRGYYPQVLSYVQAHSLKYREIEGASEVRVAGNAPDRTLVIEFGSDTTAALTFVDSVLRRVFEVDPVTHVSATFSDVSPI